MKKTFFLTVAIALMVVMAAIFVRKTVLGAQSEVFLAGNVTTKAGEKMPGVMVSAKAEGRTITTTVFTDENGNYYFPMMDPGKYRIWAQADTYETGKDEVELRRTAHKDFVMKPMEEYIQQLTGDEVVQGMPENTPEDRKMKQIFAHTCTNCHPPSYILQNRFDKDGWLSVFKLMERITVDGTFSNADQEPDPIIKYNEDELSTYLARVRGPSSSPIKVHLRPRPTGEAARVVFQEYDVPVDWSWDKRIEGHSGANDGSDWSLGTPSNMNGVRGVHDAQADMDGNIWITDEAQSSDRTIARIDARTGELRNFSFPNTRPDLVAGGHGIVMDQSGMLWFNLSYVGVETRLPGSSTAYRKPGALGRIDPTTFKVDIYNVPKGMAGTRGTLDVDPQGYIWVTTDPGVLRFDPRKQEFKEFRSTTQVNADGTGTTYGLAADSHGNAWWGQMGIDIVGKSDIETGKSEEIKLSPVTGQWEALSPDEMKLYDLAGSQWMVTKPGMQGPRRLGGDHNGDYMWVCNYWGGTFAKIDIHTNKVEYIPFPNPYVGAYSAVVDKNHNVWASEKNADRIAKYNPQTKQWTEFRLPALGTDMRWVSILEKDGTMQVIIPYIRTSKVARMTFRSEADMKALEHQIEIDSSKSTSR